MNGSENQSAVISTDQTQNFSQRSATSQTPRSFARKFWLTFLFLLAALPAVGTFRLIRNYGVDVLYWDQWGMVDASGGFCHGYIPSNLFEQNNEHRVVIPRLIYAALNKLTHWNQVSAMFAEFAIVCITSLGIYCLALLTLPRRSTNTAALIGMWFVCNLLIFSPAQYENWLWGVGIENVLPMAFIVWAMIAVRSSMWTWLKMVIACLLATAATYSSGNGVLAWPLIGLLWAWSPSLPELRKKMGLLIVWCAVFGINMAMYFHHYVRPGHSVIAYSVDKTAIVRYILAFLGAPFGFGTFLDPVTQSIYMGSALLVLLVFAIGLLLWVWRIERDFEFASRIIVWLAVAGFAVGSAVLAGPTRAGLGIFQALTSRYTTFSIYLIVALLNLALIMSQRKRRKINVWSHLTTALVTAVMIIQALVLVPDLQNAQVIYRTRLQAKAAFLLIHSLPDDDANLMLLYPVPRDMREIVENVNRAGWFHRPPVASNHAREIVAAIDPAHSAVAGGFLDGAMFTDPQHFSSNGWAFDYDKSKPMESVFLTWDHFDDDPIIFAIATMGVERSDVAKALKHPSELLCGWTVSCPASRLPGGKDPIRIRAWAFNMETAKAYPLLGQVTLQR
jgi:hypothetical protein